MARTALANDDGRLFSECAADFFPDPKSPRSFLPPNVTSDDFNEEIFNHEFSEGLQLFNRGQFFECHEVWESLWMRTPDDRAHLLKGLLQAAIAIHHFRRNNYEGARKLFEGQKRILAPFRPVTIGLDLATFDRAMDDCFAGLRSAAAGTSPRLDPALVPRLEQRAAGM